MATVTVSNFMPNGLVWSNIQTPELGNPDLITDQTATTFQFKMATTGSFADWTVNVTGTGFTYEANGTVLEPTGGAISSLIIEDANGNPVLTFDGFAAGEQPELTELYFHLFDTSNPVSPSLFDTFSLLLHGDDTINGSDNNDDLVSGIDFGNDIVNGNGGNDHIKGSAGDDVLDGGAGRDTLNYWDSYTDPTAYQGILLDVTAGTVQDCWGGNDTISNFEQYVGSRFDDTLIGSDAVQEFFYGFGGADTIDGGGGGKEFAAYDEDAWFGGVQGIVANLVAGTISDGFGAIDQVTNIQRVVGTMNNDRFIGNSADNVFGGMAGIDRFNGGEGDDQIVFWPNDGHGGLNGVRVNLAKARAQIVDDGYGNTETVRSIESVQGTAFNDVIRLAGVGGTVWGGLGRDTLGGGAGKDTFEWDSIAEFGDRVLGFQSGTDILNFYGLEGTDGVVRFENGNQSTLAGPAFYFNAANHKLYYDQDGSGGDFTGIVVATFVGINALAEGDFTIFV